MTSSVISLLSFFAVLLLIYIFVIAILLLKKYSQQKMENSNSIILANHDYVIIYASQSGKTEAYAQNTAQQLQKVGQHIVLLNIEQVTIEHLKQAKRVLWMVSSYGEGDAPDTAQSFSHQILNQQLDLSHQSFAVLAFGDRRYAQFCAFGQRLYTWLVEQHAQPWFDVITVDQNATDDLVHWNTQLEKITQCPIQLNASTKQWHTLTLVKRTLLNKGSQGSGLYHICFEFSDNLTWQSGDILEVQCRNSTMDVKKFQNDYFIGHEYFSVLQNKNLRDIPKRLENQSIDEWLSSFKNLPIREYSIASIPQQGKLELVVRQEVLQDGLGLGLGLGLGSGLLTQHLNIGESIYAHIRINPNFHLVNGNQPIIFIGNGSGIAGLLSHLHQREQWGNTKNWLIYGERQQQFDAIFKAQLDQWNQDKILTYLDLVYSRDSNQIKYVQDLLMNKQEQLKNWVDNGAMIYVCGSLKGMAENVDQTLINILGINKVKQLKSKHYYMRDVY